MSIVILGLGESGYATARYCAEHNIACQIIDTRDNPPNVIKFKAEFPQIPIYTGGFRKEILKHANTIILSPGIAKDDPALLAALPNPSKRADNSSALPVDNSNTFEIIGDIEFFARVMAAKPSASQKTLSAPIVSITGSNGKSTVTSLVGEMAKASGLKTGVGGNLGIPAMALLKPGQDLYVLELSSFQLETTSSLHSKVATVLNICPDHMDRYKTLEEYLAAKLRVFQHSEHIVMNRQEPLIAQQIPANKPTISFGSDLPRGENFGLKEAEGKLFLMKGQHTLLAASEMKIFGRHNALNALAALALGSTIDLPMEAMLSVLTEFKGLAHRCEWIREMQGITWINDSKGTNVGATLAAIEGLGNEIPGKWVLIAGGISKNADFTPLKAMVLKYCRALVLIGEAASQLQELFEGKLTLAHAQNMQEAVKKASELTQKGDGVLLSPACASFDMFKNFEDRGQKFREAVENL